MRTVFNSFFTRSFDIHRKRKVVKRKTTMYCAQPIRLWITVSSEEIKRNAENENFMLSFMINAWTFGEPLVNAVAVHISTATKAVKRTENGRCRCRLRRPFMPNNDKQNFSVVYTFLPLFGWSVTYLEIRTWWKTTKQNHSYFLIFVWLLSLCVVQCFGKCFTVRH